MSATNDGGPAFPSAGERADLLNRIADLERELTEAREQLAAAVTHPDIRSIDTLHDINGKQTGWFINDEPFEKPAALAKLEDSAITGILDRVGMFTVNGEEATGYFIRSTEDEIRALKRIPILRRVTILEVRQPKEAK